MTTLQLLRLKRNLSQQALARALGVHQSVVSRLEQGWFRRAPNGVEEGLKKIFGREWTFDPLMREPDEPEPSASEANANG
jgi:transcriptional regulator with XRE-family HTH domain